MRMLRWLVFALVLVAAPAGAGYPAHYIGDPIPDGTVLSVEAWLVDFHDRLPYGMRDPSGHYYLFGTLTVDDGVAVLEFDAIAGRYCSASIYNHNIEECYARQWNPDYYERHVLALDAGVYIASVWNGEVWLFEALTYDAETGTATFTVGAFAQDTAPPWLLDSDDYSRWRYTVRERQTPVRSRSGRRKAAP